jgi:PPOX class probable F420-dependent enzyme
MVTLAEQVARQRFAAERTAVLGTVAADGGPHLVPVTFALTDDCVVFAVDHKPKRTVELHRLENIRRNPVVSFLAAEYDDDWQHLWWVRLDARAWVAMDALQDNRYEPGLDALAAKYSQYRQLRPSGVVVIADITGVTGWACSADLPVE